MKQILQIDNALRLVPYCKVNHCEEAFAWYQDVNLVHLVDGVKRPYSQETLELCIPIWISMVSFFGLKSRRRENGFQLGMLHYLRIISPL